MREPAIYIVGNGKMAAVLKNGDYVQVFGPPYSSPALFESELKIGERYNKEATNFQFDFLNDDLNKLPKGLIDAFEQNKPIVFFLIVVILSFRRHNLSI